MTTTSAAGTTKPVYRTPFFRSLRWQEAKWGYIFLLPNLLLFLAFTVFPIFASFYYSLNEWNIHMPMQFIGLQNYQKLTQDPIFGKVLFNTFYYTFGVLPVQTALGLMIALALNQKIRLMTMYRAMYFVPVVTSMVAVSMVWQWMYEPTYGIINSFLKMIGIQGPNWLFSKEWAMPSVIIVSI